MVKRKVKDYWLNWLNATYLILTLGFGVHSFFNFVTLTSIIIFFGEIIYLIVSLIFISVILIRLYRLFHKIRAADFKLPPIKIQIHSLNLWAFIVGFGLAIGYGLQSAFTLFGNFSLLHHSFLSQDWINNLLTMQFSLAVCLLVTMTIIFICAFVLHRQRNINIKLVPDNFWAFQTAQFRGMTSFYQPLASPLWFLRYFEILLNQSQMRAYILDLTLEINYLKTIALRQFKKETTPPAYLHLLY